MQKRFGIELVETRNSMPPERITELNDNVILPELRAYRFAVGQSTREILMKLSRGDLEEDVDPNRIYKLSLLGVVNPDVFGLLEYWGRRTISGLLLMPPTRHNFVHLNEAAQVKRHVLKTSS